MNAYLGKCFRVIWISFHGLKDENTILLDHLRQIRI